MARSVVPAADEILGSYFPVLDHGFVSLVDYMGSDEDIERAARVSFGGGTRATSTIRGLIRYLRRHKHCYAPEMEVLTDRGWVRWDECDMVETFMVPDPKTRTLRPEELNLEVFSVEDEEMSCFKSERMSYRVTSDHRMWFKKKFQGTGGKESESFEIVRARDMARWGHFDPSGGYRLHEADGEKDLEYQFVGFYLGDGSWASANRVCFHLKKERKKIYLQDLLRKLGISFDTRQSSTYEDATVFWVETPEFLREVFGEKIKARSKDKWFPLDGLRELDGSMLRGLMDGLIQSDGHLRVDREQVTFSSASPFLIRLFDNISALLGIPTHVISDGAAVSSYLGRGSTLEARKQFFSAEHYTGKVYCSTTSTGLLVVRGAPDEFGFICGNTTPSEMVELKFHCAMPIFIARQWIRHRTANVNEYSGRYSLMPMLFYTPEKEQFLPQSKTNKQGRDGEAFGDEFYEGTKAKWQDGRRAAEVNYSAMTEAEVAREIARIDLPLSTYTQWYWKIDLHNLMHFLALRVDSHAQWEIREYGKVMAGMMKRVAPLSYEAWVDYDVCGVRFSRIEMEAIRCLLLASKESGLYTCVPPTSVGVDKLAEMGLGEREVTELLGKFERLGSIPDFELDLSRAKPATFFEEKIAASVPKTDKTP